MVLATVGLSFALLEEIAINRTVDLTIVVKAIKNVISGNLWDHMWYIYAIIGIYLVSPVLHSFMSSSKTNRLIITSLLFFFTIIIPSFKQYLSIGIDFPFGGYLFYVCFGCMVAKQDFSKKANLCIVLSGFLSIIWVLFNPYNDYFGYESLAICLIALSIFILISALSIKPGKFITTVSSCTWGIYLIHPFFINVVVKGLKIDLLSHMPYLKLTIFFILVSLISFVVTYVLRKIPMVKKLF